MKTPARDPILVRAALLGDAGRRARPTRATDFAALPWRQILQRAAHLSAGCRQGQVADYIPALARVAPDRFGIAVATLDGSVYSVER